MTAIVIDPTPMRIPSLRQELRIEPGAPMVNGAPCWTLFDPVRHLFFQLGQIEYRIFARWAKGELGLLAHDLAEEGVAEGDVDIAFSRVLEFSVSNQLTQSPMGETVPTFLQQRAAQKKAWWRWMVDNYLFFRMPLVRPARFLERTVSHVTPLISLRAVWGFAALAIFAFYLVSRQWDQFLVSFLYFFSWDGVVAYAFGLSVVKIIHELGHAYTATRYGCRVPTMGVSFLVMFPVLYTDTTSAWRLRSRRQRLAIDCAGVTAELMVATLATLAWVFVPEGTTRSILFVLATSSWLMSLAVNLNPFMRFDGYYVLADWLGVANLQPRSFALGRWAMREALFDFGEAAPEQVPHRLRNGMIAYAWATWLYRLVLFIGIALLVYHLFFKALGIVLFIVEMGVFIARPLWVEMKEWHRRRDKLFRSKRGRWWPWILGGGFLLACLPLDRHVSAVAILAPMDAAPIVPGDPARIDRIAVRNGQLVRAGDVIAEMTAPEITAYSDQNETRIRQLQAQLARAPADARDLANRAILERELASEKAGAAGAERRRDRLVLRSPIAGIVVDITPDMHPGRWLGGAVVVARVLSSQRYDIQAYLAENDVWRVDSHAMGKFIPDDLSQPSRPAKLVESASSALERIDQPMLASIHGGPIAVNEDRAKQLRPRDALYRFRFVAPVDTTPSIAAIQPIPGKIVIDAQPTSLIGGLLRSIARIWRSEASIS